MPYTKDTGYPGRLAWGGVSKTPQSPAQDGEIVVKLGATLKGKRRWEASCRAQPCPTESDFPVPGTDTFPIALVCLRATTTAKAIG